MLILSTSDITQERVLGVPISPQVGSLLHGDDNIAGGGGENNSFTICATMLITVAGSSAEYLSCFEFTDSSQVCWALHYEPTPGSNVWRLRVTAVNNNRAAVDLPFDPARRWIDVYIAVTRVKINDGQFNQIRMTLVDRATGNTYTHGTASYIGTSVGMTRPTSFSFGRRYTSLISDNTSQVAGAFAVGVRADLIYDGTNVTAWAKATDTDVSTATRSAAAVSALGGLCPWWRVDSGSLLVWAVNHGGSGKAWNGGGEGRIGGDVNGQTLLVYDSAYTPDRGSVTAIGTGTNPNITVPTHGRSSVGESINFVNTNSTPGINGGRNVGSIVDANNITLQASPGNITVAGTAGRMGGASGYNFPWYYNRVSNASLTITGSPKHTGPYSLVTFSGSTLPVPTPPMTLTAGALPATTLPRQPTGRPGPVATQLIRAIKRQSYVAGGVRRIGVVANSRAVYPTTAQVVLTDGNISTRQVPFNLTEMGLLSQSQLWAGGIIGMGNPALPTGLWGAGATGSESDAAEHNWGLDCGASRPRCYDHGGAATANVATATKRAINTTLSTFWSGSRSAPPGGPSGAGNRYRGNAATRIIRPDYEYRASVRDESGLPVSDRLRCRVVLCNFPSASQLHSVTPHVSASQSGADVAGLSALSGLPTMGSALASKAITAHTGPTYADDTTISAYGVITVDDSGGEWAGVVVGDVLEVCQNDGTTKVQPGGDADATYACPELTTIRAITGKGTASCVITYDHIFKNSISAGGGSPDTARVLDGREIYKVIEYTFAAGAATAGQWRGLSIRVANGTGGGVCLCSCPYENPDRAGYVPTMMGRSGVGHRYQAHRYHTTPHAADGKSVLSRMMEVLGLHLLVVSIADQGNAGGFYGASFEAHVDSLRSSAKLTTIEPELWVLGTGPEWVSEGSANYTDDPKADHTAAMRQSCVNRGWFMTSWWFSPQGGDTFSRIESGDDITEGQTHPGTAKDWLLAAMQAPIAGWRRSARGVSPGGRSRMKRGYRALT